MNDNTNPHRSPRTAHARFRLPSTWAELALYIGFTVIIPLTLFALAHPTVVVATVAGLSAGLLARPLHHRITRQSNQSGSIERSSNTVGPTTAKD